MTKHDVVWDFDTLNAYIEAPQAVVKGTKMSYTGIKDADQRRNLIAYLKVEGTPRAQPASAETSDEASSN